MDTRPGPDPVRAVIYLRQSLDVDGNRLAVDRQREDCLKIVHDRGWQLVSEYVDNSISASDKRKNRPGFNAMLDDFEHGRFDALVCWDLDRLTRQPRQLEDFIDAAEDRGLKLVTANGEADLSTDGGRLFARIKAAVARGEIERKSARQRRAAQQRVEMGRPPASGARLFGYAHGGTEIIPEEAAVVRMLFDRFARGDSLNALARKLDELAVPTRFGGKRWSPSTIRQYLTNARYAGRQTYQGADTGRHGTWPAIVSEDEFAVVNARLSHPGRRTSKIGTDRRTLGSGLYLCDECGGHVSGWTNDRYRCRECGLSRQAGPIDELVLSMTRARLGDPRLAAAMVRGDDEAAETLNQRAAELRTRLDSIAADYDSGLIDGARYASATGRVEEELRQVDAQRASRLGDPAIASALLAADPVAAFNAETIGVQRAVVSALLTVRLKRAPVGRKKFDVESVVISPRGH